jgi:hypothetical protein
VQGADLGGEPAADALHGCLAGLDQQLPVAVAADAEPEEVKAIFEADDTRLVLVEGQAPGREPLREAVFDLLHLFGADAQRDQVIGVPHHDGAAGDRFPGVLAAVGVVPGPGCCFQPVQGHVHHQRAGHPALGVPSLVGVSVPFSITPAFSQPAIMSLAGNEPSAASSRW